MIEQIVIDYLSQYVPTYAEEPHEPPADERFCVIEKTGGGGNAPGIREATLAVKAYALTLRDAAELCERVIGWMDALPLLPSVSRCELNSSYNYTDDRKKAYRYQAVFAVVYYA